MKHFSTRVILIFLLWLAMSLAACDSRTVAEATATPAIESTAAAVTTAAESEPTGPAEQISPTAEPAAPTPIATETVTATATAFAAVVLTPATGSSPALYIYEVVDTFPHDPAAFTQGLVYEDGVLFEGTGLRGESSLREVDLESGTVLRMHNLEDQYFGEGITLFDDKIYQITWQEQTGFIYDPATFEPLGTFSYPHEGWGITHDGQRLIVSDGTPTIRFWDPDTLEEIGRIMVHDSRGTVERLNELEYINGEIWANIWLTDQIARISPETGEVTGYVDLTGLLDTSNLTQPVDVLNGIAYDAANDRLFVTGKLWPTLFEIRVIPAP
jgi:glutamine cyclotransferase